MGIRKEKPNNSLPLELTKGYSQYKSSIGTIALILCRGEDKNKLKFFPINSCQNTKAKTHKGY
ncbi:MAG: hypothetical protein RML72_00220 [Bacteroidia bacterium]|nr:hypothetical protein [Bacteroidia bacterium]